MPKLDVQTDVKDVLSSIRELVADTKQISPSSVKQLENDRFVLTQRLRVGQSGVLRLLPEQAVSHEQAWPSGDEPPFVLGADARLTRLEPVEQDGNIIQTKSRPTPQSGSVRGLTAKIEALEKAISKTADQWEPDGAGLDAYSGKQLLAMEWPDNIDLDGLGNPLVSSGKTAGPSEAEIETETPLGPLTQTVDRSVVDEVMLRKIVAEIVQSELHGELGRRITRNVRKLVRREIQSALAAKSWD